MNKIGLVKLEAILSIQTYIFRRISGGMQNMGYGLYEACMSSVTTGFRFP